MDISYKPEHIFLKSNEIYQLFYLKTIDILKNEHDIKELFNQAIDAVTDEMYNEASGGYHIVMDMLRCKTFNEASNKYLTNSFRQLCVELKAILIELKLSPIIDMTTMREIFPYYFYKVIKGRIILKRL